MMRKAAFLTFLAVFLSACAARPVEQALRQPLTPMPEHTDPSDDVLVQGVEAFLAENGAPVASRFAFKRYDLDGDGRRDALVLFTNPYGYWCGLYGCTMLVLKADNSKFNIVNAVQPVRDPLYISTVKTNGWNDLIVHVSGRWTETKDVALQFDGKAYPANPSDLPSCNPLEVTRLTRLFYD